MQSLAEFFHMGGYAAFVWPAFGLSLVILLAGLLLPINNEKKTLRRLRKKMERERQRT